MATAQAETSIREIQLTLELDEALALVALWGFIGGSSSTPGATVGNTLLTLADALQVDPGFTYNENGLSHEGTFTPGSELIFSDDCTAERLRELAGV